MATTVQGGFSVLLSRQHLTDSQKVIADARIEGLTTFFAKNFAMAAGLFLAGSYGRRTICRGQRDIDLIAPLSLSIYKATHGSNPQGFLYFVRNRLNERYHTTKVSSKRVAVTLNFTNISVDIVPCFPRPSGGGYLMPNGKGDWMPTNPRFHNTYFATVNGTHGNNFKPLVRLIKAWNLANGKHLRSFHIEVILERMWDGKSIDADAWPKVVARTLNGMVSSVRSKKYDPWDSSIRIDDYLSSTERGLVIRRLTADAERAKAAEQYRKDGKIEKAFERWGVVYNHTFPAYR